MSMLMDDTIAAIATAPGEGAVAIVRLSGPDAFPIADQIFKGRGRPPSLRLPFTFAHGQIIGETGEVIDEVLILLMRAPNSYTREDVIEVQSHGGDLSARRILRRILDAGARPAEPGEFTRRAFLSGRIDLMQAEAVADLVRSKSERAAAAAAEQLAGILSERFNRLYDRIVAVAADLEATLDFPEDELPNTVVGDIRNRLIQIRTEASVLATTWGEGHLLRNGALVVISGRPNVGKSTLMNCLLGKDRSIISSTPGTTRDTVEEGLILDGIPLRLMDTAGLRSTHCEIEREGIRRAEESMHNSDFQVFVMDASCPLGEEDYRWLDHLRSQSPIIVLNKIDLGCRVDPSGFHSRSVIRASLIHGEGMDQIRRALTDRMERGLNLAARPQAAVSERHRRLLADVIHEVDTAAEQISADGDHTLIAASALSVALNRLGEATGRVYQEELLDQIFARFCIGK